MTLQVRPPRYIYQNIGGVPGWYLIPRPPILIAGATWRMTSLSASSEFTPLPPDTTYGIPAGTSLTPVYGDPSGVLSLSGYHYRKEFFNFVDASSATFEQCAFRGRAPGGSFRQGLITSNATAAGSIKLINCEIAPQKAAGMYYMNGIEGSGVDLNWCNIYNCVDSIHGDKNIRAYDTWFHHMAFYMYNGTTLGGPGTSGGDHAGDSRWPGATHNDHFQSSGGSGHVFQRCIFDGFIAHAHASYKNHPGYIADACGNWQSIYNDTTKGFGFTNSGAARAEWNGAGQESGKWGSCIIASPKSDVVGGTIKDCIMDGTEVLFQMPFQGGSYPSSGCNWNITGNQLGIPHGYASFKRFEQMRMTSAMGTITVDSPNTYGHLDTVTGLIGTPTTSPAPVPGNGVAGTNNGGVFSGTTFNYTTRIA